MLAQLALIWIARPQTASIQRCIPRRIHDPGKRPPAGKTHATGGGLNAASDAGHAANLPAAAAGKLNAVVRLEQAQRANHEGGQGKRILNAICRAG